MTERKLCAETSLRIRAIQFFLVSMIILIHSERGVVHYGEPLAFSSSAILIFFSNNLARIAVPLYFMISCYLAASKKITNFKEYKDFVISKFFRLMVPFIIFNAIAIIIATVLKTDIPGSGRIYDQTGKNILFSFVSSYNFPLWFLRNLFILFLAFPLFQYLYRRLPYIGLGTCLVLFLYGSYNPFLLWEFVLAFYIGGLIYCKRFNLQIFDRLAPFSIVIYCIIIAIISILDASRTQLLYASSLYYRLMKLLIIYIGIASIWGLFSINKIKFNKFLLYISRHCFLIYLIHEPTLSFIQSYLRTQLGMKEAISQLLVYFFGAALTLVLTILIAVVLKKYFNKLYQFLTGELQSNLFKRIS